jgi:hypothetical protein
VRPSRCCTTSASPVMQSWNSLPDNTVSSRTEPDAPLSM